RHLVMPGGIAGTEAIIHFLAEEVSPDTYVNVMDQYYPAGRVDWDHFPEINRRITAEEYETALEHARRAGLWRFDTRRLTRIGPRN
ncbi:MAG: radical SAM protein, partial [Acidobacteria bacterium]|nr:radical SAM protein [Acidobacteriota bacterium]